MSLYILGRNNKHNGSRKLTGKNIPALTVRTGVVYSVTELFFFPQSVTLLSC